eukprot:2940749-Prymnesium_polylepis.1
MGGSSPRGGSSCTSSDDGGGSPTPSKSFGAKASFNHTRSGRFKQRAQSECVPSPPPTSAVVTHMRAPEGYNTTASGRFVRARSDHGAGNAAAARQMRTYSACDASSSSAGAMGMGTVPERGRQRADSDGAPDPALRGGGGGVDAGGASPAGAGKGGAGKR